MTKRENIKKYLATNKPEIPQKQRFNKKCEDCGSIFFGNSQKDANYKEVKHHFDGKCNVK